LDKGDARFLFAADDLDALLDEAFFLVSAAFTDEITDGFGMPLVDFQFATRPALFGVGAHNDLDLLIGEFRQFPLTHYPNSSAIDGQRFRLYVHIVYMPWYRWQILVVRP
jgi:hypothetical protein